MGGQGALDEGLGWRREGTGAVSVAADPWAGARQGMTPSLPSPRLLAWLYLVPASPEQLAGPSLPGSAPGGGDGGGNLLQEQTAQPRAEQGGGPDPCCPGRWHPGPGAEQRQPPRYWPGPAGAPQAPCSCAVQPWAQQPQAGPAPGRVGSPDACTAMSQLHCSGPRHEPPCPAPLGGAARLVPAQG